MGSLLSALPAGAIALAVGAAAGGFWIAVRAHQRLERRRIETGHSEPCRRCGARN